MSHFTTVWLKENQVRLVGSYRSFTCIYTRNRPTIDGAIEVLLAVPGSLASWAAKKQRRAAEQRRAPPVSRLNSDERPSNKLLSVIYVVRGTDEDVWIAFGASHHKRRVSPLACVSPGCLEPEASPCQCTYAVKYSPARYQIVSDFFKVT